METFDYQAQKQSLMEEPLPFKVVTPAEIRYCDNTGDNVNIIKVQGVELPASGGAILSLDKYSGFTQAQKNVVSQAGGQQGVRDMRNYLIAAKGATSKGKLALILNPYSGMVTRVIPVFDQVITPAAAIRVAELFMEQNDLYPVAMEKNYLSNGFSLIMKSSNPKVLPILPEDEANLGGFAMNWDFNQISLAMMTLRLVCTNGMVHLVRDTRARITNLHPESVKNLISVPKDSKLIGTTFEEFRKHAAGAKAVPASLAEVLEVNRKLRRLGIPEESCDIIAPYQQDLKAYQERDLIQGAPSMALARRTVSSVNAWDLFNNMTAFASHTKLLGTGDPIRGEIRHEAAQFLATPRDIKHYVDIFSGRR
jgi:hypothetical protein